MALNKELYTSNSSVLDAAIIYDRTKAKLQSSINASTILQPNARITVPTGSTGVTKTLTGLTADHILVRWNFYDAASNGNTIAENAPPQDMEWTTTTNSFTLKNGGSSSVYCQPVFALPTKLAAT